MRFKVYIPARYSSTRLPGKMLADVCGWPLLRHVYTRALESGAEEVIIATDDDRIFSVAESFGANVVMTSDQLRSGTDRVEAAARIRGELTVTIVVNLQGDEPLMPGAVIRQVAACVANSNCDIATVCEPLAIRHASNPNIVKVARDKNHNALLFSRSVIPYCRESSADSESALLTENLYRRHIGIYAYRMNYLSRFVSFPVAESEKLESLEQLRALYQGSSISVPDALLPCGSGVDTSKQLDALRIKLAGK
ncbi:MAG: 3-deoxy-manno-octulosonate cytidylyltransferase [Proteobacteria bacterium]|nr:3-deoxy-manno-octulosonate cytidylyltransferase [Pseudomonadota bacterium]